MAYVGYGTTRVGELCALQETPTALAVASSALACVVHAENILKNTHMHRRQFCTSIAALLLKPLANKMAPNLTAFFFLKEDSQAGTKQANYTPLWKDNKPYQAIQSDYNYAWSTNIAA